MQTTSFVSPADVSLADFQRCCEQTVNLTEYPLAKDVQRNVLLYDGDRLRDAAAHPQSALAMKAELFRCLQAGPGVFVIAGAYEEIRVIDRATEVFQQIIAEEKSSAARRGDHFAKPGDNDRIWNSLQKFCERDPEAFADYHANPVLVLAYEAWLGPHFQLTAQVNVVKPGGEAQQPHRDYHLGFQSDEVVSQYPLAMQVQSQLLTLQGGVAHTDMRVASGPTMLLPFSQQYPLGYLAWRREAFRAYFREHMVQLPLNQGDAIFFSPALFHGAGTNHESTDRIVNLLQVSSAFGRSMESVNRALMSQQLFPVLRQRLSGQSISAAELSAVLASSAEGYSFPTNLDLDPPLQGSAPESMQALLLRGLEGAWTPQRFAAELSAWEQRRRV